MNEWMDGWMMTLFLLELDLITKIYGITTQSGSSMSAAALVASRSIFTAVLRLLKRPEVTCVSLAHSCACPADCGTRCFRDAPIGASQDVQRGTLSRVVAALHVRVCMRAFACVCACILGMAGR